MLGDQLHESRFARTSLPSKPVDPVSTFQPCSEARIRFVVSQIFGLQDPLESVGMSVFHAFLPRSHPRIVQPFQQRLGPRGRVTDASVTVDAVADKDPCISGDIDVFDTGGTRPCRSIVL